MFGMMIIPTTTRCGHILLYKQKTGGKQFLDFIKRVVDQKYNDRNIKQIFLIPDNVSIHKSNNKVKKRNASQRHHPRIHL